MSDFPWIDAAEALGTWAVAIAAIWGGRIQSLLYPPGLKIALENNTGDLTTETLFTRGEDGQITSRQRQGRYFRIVVSNTRKGRWPTAHNAQVLLTTIEAPGPSGQPQVTWRGELPLGWMHGEAFPPVRDIGPPATADFIVVTSENTMHIQTVIEPASTFQRNYAGPTRLWLTVLARTQEVDSNQLRVEVGWDGKWDAGTAEMGSHFKLSSTAAL